MPTLIRDANLFLNDYQSWRKRRGLDPASMKPEEVDPYIEDMAPAGDPWRMSRARSNSATDMFDPTRKRLGDEEGVSEVSGRPLRAFATMRVEQAMNDAGAAPVPNYLGAPLPTNMRAPAPRTDPNAVRAAMSPGRPPTMPAEEQPSGQPQSGAVNPMNPERIMSPQDRLTLAMWSGSNDTSRGVVDRYNAVAKKYGMTLKSTRTDANEARNRLRMTGGDWMPGARGGAVNRVTGESNEPLPAAEQIDWGKRLVKQADGTYRDMETDSVIGPKATPDQIDWGKRMVKQEDGTYRDMETGTIVGQPKKLQGSEKYMNLGEGRLFDMETGSYVKPDGTPDPRKDKYQGRVVKIPTGADSFMVGVFDKKAGVYTWKPNVKNGTTFQNADGSSLTFGGESGLDLTAVPNFVDPDVPVNNGAEGIPTTGAAETPIGRKIKRNGKLMIKRRQASPGDDGFDPVE